jgi:hypothetical protein
MAELVAVAVAVGRHAATGLATCPPAGAAFYWGLAAMWEAGWCGYECHWAPHARACLQWGQRGMQVMARRACLVLAPLRTLPAAEIWRSGLLRGGSSARCLSAA